MDGGKTSRSSSLDCGSSLSDTMVLLGGEWEKTVYVSFFVRTVDDLASTVSGSVGFLVADF